MTEPRDNSCANCKWFKRNQSIPKTDKCTHPNAHAGLGAQKVVYATFLCASHVEKNPMKAGDWAKYYQLVAEPDEIGFNLKMRLCRIEKVCPVMVCISLLESLTDDIFYLTTGKLGKTKLVHPSELTVIK